MKLPLPQVRVLIKGHVLKVSAEYPGEHGRVFRVVEIHHGSQEPISLFCFHWSLLKQLDICVEQLVTFFCRPPKDGQTTLDKFKIGETWYRPDSEIAKDKDSALRG